MDKVEQRQKAAHAALELAMKLCPEAEFVVVSGQVDEDAAELDMTCVSNVPPKRAIQLLEYGIDDYENLPVEHTLVQS